MELVFRTLDSFKSFSSGSWEGGTGSPHPTTQRLCWTTGVDKPGTPPSAPRWLFDSRLTKLSGPVWVHIKVCGRPRGGPGPSSHARLFRRPHPSSCRSSLRDNAGESTWKEEGELSLRGLPIEVGRGAGRVGEMMKSLGRQGPPSFLTRTKLS